MSRVFANSPEDRGSIPGRVMSKTEQMVLDACLLNTQHYKVLSRVMWINPGKGVTLGALTNERETFRSSRLRSPTLLLLICKLLKAFVV